LFANVTTQLGREAKIHKQEKPLPQAILRLY